MVRFAPSGRVGGLAAILLLAGAVAGCGASDASSGSARVTATCAGHDSSVASVTVTVSQGDGASFTAISSELSKDGSGWSGRVSAIPAGSGREFDVVARGFDGSELCTGSAKCDVASGGEASVSVALSDGSGGKPTILSLVATQSMVATGGSTDVTVVASDASGGVLRYRWSATCGAFDAPALAKTTWTAPAAEGSCQLSVEVASSLGTSVAYVIIGVGTIPTVDRCAGVMCQASDACHVAGTCNPATGKCSAGTAVTCQASDRCHAVGACVPATGCPPETPVTCPAASDACHIAGTCDPATGCSAETAKTCPAGQVCDPADSGTCKVDLCIQNHVTCQASDACHIAGTCNPVDGSCSPETPKCPPSDLCHVRACDLASGGTCSAETAKTCSSGEVCDPADGNCKLAVPKPVVERADGAHVNASGIAYDATGAIYRAGFLVVPYDFGTGTITPAPGPGDETADLWLGQFDPSGAGLAVPAVWVKNYGDGADQYANGIARSSDRIGIIGDFLGTLDLGNGHAFTNPDAANSLPVVALFDPATHAPTYMKTIHLGGGTLAQIASNPLTNRIAICGSAQDFAATDLDPAAAAGGGQDIVVAVFDTSGLVWGKQFGGTGNQYCAAVTVDDAGDVIIAGSYSAGSLDFGAGELQPAATSSNQNVFVAKLSGANGSLVRAVGFGPATGAGRSVANGVAVAANGDVAVTGNVLARITFGSVTIIGTGNTTADAYAVKLNAADYSVATGWPVRIGGPQGDAGNSVTIDSQNHVWVAGIFNGTTTSPGPDGRGAVAMTSNGGTDAFVVEFAPDASVLFSDHFGDNFGQSATTIVSTRLAAQDVIWMGGSFASQIQFGSLPALTTTGSTDVRDFLVKVQQ